jgi:hypothetical protein
MRVPRFAVRVVAMAEPATDESVADDPTEDPPIHIRALARSLLGDPHHAPERLVRYAVDHLGESSYAYAARQHERYPDARPAQLDSRVHDETVKLTRIDGAISGTPFLIALVPAYVAVLWEQVRMALRMAALHGRDPRDPAIAAELLWLRGAHPDLASAQKALDAAAAGAKGRGDTPFMSAWYELGMRFLVLAGFIDAPDPNVKRSNVKRAISWTIAGGVWVFTWVFPLTFMAMMSWACSASTDTLAVRAREYYGHGAVKEQLPPGPRVSRRRRILRGIGLTLTVGVPLAALAVAVTSKPDGIQWYYVLAAITGLGLVLAMSSAIARR